MAVKTWQTIKIRYCDRTGCEVGLEVETIYPADHLPDQPPQTKSHRCSHGKECMIYQENSCVWSGGNPEVDPFK